MSYTYTAELKTVEKPKISQITFYYIRGKFIGDTEIFGEVDPYLTVKYDGEEKKTETIDGGGSIV